MSTMNLFRAAASLAAVFSALAACSGDPVAPGTDTAIDPSDADTTGAGDTVEYTDAPIVVGNKAPEVTIQSPKQAQEYQFGDPISIVARVLDDRTRPYNLDLTLTSSVNRQVGKPVANEAGFVTFELSTLSPGNHVLELTARDPDGGVGAASVNIMVNGAPNVGAVVIDPDVAVTDSELVARLTVPFADPNRANDQLVITWQWFRDGQDQSIAQPRVPANRTAKGEVWRVLATATDPFGKRAQAEATTTIGNTTPTCDLATMLPSSGRTDTNFTCRCAERTDPDAGDPIADRCAFYDGTVKLTAEGCTLPASSTARGMDITCRLIPSDGTSDGTEVLSDTVPILNTPPTRPIAEIGPTQGDVRTTFTCTVTGMPTDADSDPIDLEYTWVVNGFENPGTTSTTVVPLDSLVSNPAGKPARGGDRLSCRVRANDGAERSQAGDTLVITLVNNAPTGGVVTLGPLGAGENDVLTCIANGGEDVDGDSISWTYTWQINGQTLPNVQTPTLAPSYFTVGDSVKCIATPGDGFEDGVPQESKNAIVIVNAAPTKPVVDVLAPLGADGPVVCHITVPSIDKEPLTQTIFWTINDGAEFIGTSTLAAAQVDNCNVVRCRLQVTDGNTTVSSDLTEEVMPVGSCDAGGDCTSAVCLPNGQCAVQNVTGSCTDNNACTTGDHCVQGGCVGDPKNCDDNQFCTDDSCEAATGICRHPPTTFACEDGNPCTVDNCDFQANGGAGGCGFQPLDNVPCNVDDNGCTFGDKCVAGQCRAGAFVNCEEGQAPNECLTRSCRSTGSNAYVCDNEFYDVTVGCEDGFWCTIGDHCNGQGLCTQGVNRDCGIGLSTCQTGACDEAVNSCRTESLPDNALCNFDSDGCTVDDRCQTGLCRQGARADCSEVANDCNDATCVSTAPNAHTCAEVPAVAGKACTSADFCVINMTCDGDGTCAGGAPRDCDAEVGDECLTTYCDSIFAACIPEPITAGTPCDDGDTCSNGDRCVFGVCEPTGSICLEDPLTFGTVNIADTAPAMAHIGNGRYVVEWHKSVNSTSQTYFRPSNDQGSRENEETFVGAGLLDRNISGPGQRLLGAAVRTDGRFALVVAANEAYCGTSRWCGDAGDRTIDHQVRLVVYNANVVPVATGIAVNITGTKVAYDTEVNLGIVAQPLAFADGSWGVVVSPQLTGTATSTSSLGRGIWLAPAGADLAGGTPVKLVDLGGTANVSKFGAAQFPESDDFLVTWVHTDGRTVKALRYDRYGAPSPAGAKDVAVVTTGHTVDDVRVAAFRDGGYAVMYSDNNAGVAMGKVVRVFPAILGLADITFNLDTVGGHTLGKIATFADKSLVAVWTSATADGNGTAVQARVWDANGVPFGPAFVTHQTTAGDQRLPGVAVVGSDAFVVGFVGPDGSVYTRLYDRRGGSLAGRPEVEVSQTPQADQVAPSAAGDQQGRVLVAFESTSTGVTVADVFARQYDLAGLPMGEQYRVNTTTAGAQRTPAVAGTNGAFVAVWASDGQDGSLRGIYARRLSGTSANHGAELRVNTTTTGDQYAPDVAMDDAGDWMVVWVDGNGVKARGFNADTALGAEVTLDAGAVGAATAPEVTAIPGTSSFLATWAAAQAGGGSAPVVVKLSKTGLVEVATVTYGLAEGAAAVRTVPTIAAGPAGQGIVCWRLLSPERISCQVLEIANLGTVNAAIPMTNGRAVGAPTVEWLAVGGAAVAWSAEAVDVASSTGAAFAVQYARVSSSGTVTTPRVMGNRFRSSNQIAPAIGRATGSASPLILAWQSLSQDLDGWGVYLRTLDMTPYP